MHVAVFNELINYYLVYPTPPLMKSNFLWVSFLKYFE